MADAKHDQSTQNPKDFMRGGEGVTEELLQATIRVLDHFDALAVNQRARRIVFQLSGITPGDTVLDAGCGIGHNTRRLAEAVGPSGMAIGVDLNAHLLSIASERSADDEVQPEYHAGNLERLGFRDATFDVAWCHHVLEWVDDPGQVINELVRVLKPGGRLVCKSNDWGTHTDGKSDPVVGDAIVAASLEDISHPREARMLPKRFRDRGLEQIHVRAELMFRDTNTFKDNELVFRELARARGAGDIDEDEYDILHVEAEAARRTGTDFDYRVMLIVGGIKPLN